MSELDPQIEAYLDRAMDAGAMAQFSRRLAEDPELAKAFIVAVRFDVAMRSQYRGEVEVDGVLVGEGDGLAGLEDNDDRSGWLEGLHALEDRAEGARLVDATDLVRERDARAKKRERRQAALRAQRREQWQRANPSGSRTPLTLLVAAAVLLLFAGVVYWFSVGQSSPAQPPVVEVDPPPGGPGAGGAEQGRLWDTGVVLTARSTPTWGQAPTPEAASADTLTAGTYRLTEGVAELIYPGGAVVTVLAPAEIELSRRNGLSVVSGKVLCEVPADSEVFLVDTGTRRFASRGARLGMHVDADRVTSYVFAGSAEYRDGGEQVQLGRADRLVVRAGVAAVVEPDSARPNDLPGDYAGFAAFARGRVRIAETFDEPSVLVRFVVRQGYMTIGSTPGRADVRNGRLELEPGGNNTVCCYLEQDGRALPAGARWVVDLAEMPTMRSDDQYAVFLCVSDAPTQPGAANPEMPARSGAAGFRLRYDVGKHFLRIEADGASPAADADHDLQVTSPVSRLAIGRLAADRFAFWVMYTGEDRWHLVGEQRHRGLSAERSLYVGVEVFSWYRGRTFGFDNLRLEQID